MFIGEIQDFTSEISDLSLTVSDKYSEVPIIRPPMILVESGLNDEQVLLMKPIYIEKCILVLKNDWS